MPHIVTEVRTGYRRREPAISVEQSEVAGEQDRTEGVQDLPEDEDEDEDAHSRSRS